MVDDGDKFKTQLERKKKIAVTGNPAGRSLSIFPLCRLQIIFQECPFYFIYNTVKRRIRISISVMWIFTSFFKDKKSKRSHKTVEIKVFLTIVAQ
jgi:hypothetical protein